MDDSGSDPEIVSCSVVAGSRAPGLGSRDDTRASTGFVNIANLGDRDNDRGKDKDKVSDRKSDDDNTSTCSLVARCRAPGPSGLDDTRASPGFDVSRCKDDGGSINSVVTGSRVPGSSKHGAARASPGLCDKRPTSYDMTNSLVTGSRVPGSGRHGADRAYPGFHEDKTSTPSINTSAIHFDRAENNVAVGGRAACDYYRSGRAHTERQTIVNYPMVPTSIVYPSYVKRGRDDGSYERECIKRLCSVASGARATGSGSNGSPRDSPGLGGTKVVDINGQLASTTKGGCTHDQPGDSSDRVVDCATMGVAFTARATPDTIATPGVDVVAPGGSLAPSTSTDAPTAPDDATAPAPATATVDVPTAARGLKRAASEDSSELRGKQHFNNANALQRFRLRSKQCTKAYSLRG
jgi:hypothetical protein